MHLGQCSALSDFFPPAFPPSRCISLTPPGLAVGLRALSSRPTYVTAGFDASRSKLFLRTHLLAPIRRDYALLHSPKSRTLIIVSIDVGCYLGVMDLCSLRCSASADKQRPCHQQDITRGDHQDWGWCRPAAWYRSGRRNMA